MGKEKFISNDQARVLETQVVNLEQKLNEIQNDSLDTEQPTYEPGILRNGIISQRTLSYAEQPYLNAQFSGMNTMNGMNIPTANTMNGMNIPTANTMNGMNIPTANTMNGMNIPTVVPFRGNDMAITGAGQIVMNPQQVNSLDRITNPLRYPYRSPDFYQYGFYPDMNLPAEVIGGGWRNTPTYGGTQVPILNPLPSVPINNLNIAPVNISTQGPLGQPQAIGILYKVNGSENQILPLFGRRRYPNDNKYDYYTILGNNNTYPLKVPVITKNKNIELGSNDLVFIKGSKDPYRATLYEYDFPQYIPYL